MALDLPENVVVSKLEHCANWAQANSLWPMPFATACCGIELMATGASRARPGPLRRRGDALQPAAVRPDDRRRPRGDEDAAGAAAHLAADARAEVVHLDGRLRLDRRRVRHLCVVQGIDRFIPVDMYVPGCPPRPEQLIQAIIDLQDKIQREGTIGGRGVRNATRPAAAEAGPGRVAGDLAAATASSRSAADGVESSRRRMDSVQPRRHGAMIDACCTDFAAARRPFRGSP